MEHPLLNNPNDLSDDDLQKKISEIFARMQFFGQMGNTQAHQQANLIYGQLVENFQERARRAFEKTGDDDEPNPYADKIDISRR